LAFLRYLELHGGSVTVEEDGCAVEREPLRSAERVVLTFWHPRAAEEFDEFWRRYRLAYN
jgi:hypothetical protein